MNRALKLLIPLLITAILIYLFQSVLLLGYVPSSSMEPTLSEGSIILGSRCFEELKRGDIIIFRHDGRLMVKRIAAGPGEKLSEGDSSCTVPEDCYFVLGDNSADSYDSRFWADPFLPRKDIVAKLIFPVQKAAYTIYLDRISGPFLFLWGFSPSKNVPLFIRVREVSDKRFQYVESAVLFLRGKLIQPVSE